jgi:exosortase
MPKFRRTASPSRRATFASLFENTRPRGNLPPLHATLTPPAPRAAAAAAASRLPLLLTLAVIGGLWVVLCYWLSNEWSANEQYNYGWFVPFFALYLFWLRWEDRPVGRGGLDGTAAQGSGAKRGNAQHQDRPPAHGNDPENARPKRLSFILLTSAFFLLFLLLPIRLFGIAAPDWRALGWLHAAVVVFLTLVALWYAGGPRWVKHFAFPVAFMLVAVPWLAGVENAVVQGLMRTVAAIASESLMLVGIPAQLEGNLIRIHSGVVGVNEACSGVRSLQTSVMIGLLFGELKRLQVGRRIGLLAAAVGIALVANFVRAMVLVMIAVYQGVDAADKWHDLTGYSIVVLVFAGTMLAASWLSGDKQPEPEARDKAAPRPAGTVRFAPVSVLAAAAIWLLAVEVGAEAWYRSHEAKMVPRTGWAVDWPDDAQSFRELPIDEGVQRILRYDEGTSVAWRDQVNAAPAAATPLPVHCVGYFFRWNSGRNSILRARGHRPDICLPASGWQQTADHGTDVVQLGAVALPIRHFEFQHGGAPRQLAAPARSQFAHTFYVVQEDSVRASAPVVATDPKFSEMRGVTLIPYLWRLVREGERPRGQQVLQVVFITTTPMPEPAAKAELHQLLRDVVAVR